MSEYGNHFPSSQQKIEERKKGIEMFLDCLEKTVERLEKLGFPKENAMRGAARLLGAESELFGDGYSDGGHH